jgi:hypothetical protein
MLPATFRAATVMLLVKSAGCPNKPRSARPFPAMTGSWTGSSDCTNARTRSNILDMGSFSGEYRNICRSAQVKTPCQPESVAISAALW